MKKKKIMVAGHISLDITPEFRNSPTQKFSKVLQQGKLTNVGTAQMALGGAVSNTGLALHKLGADVVLTAKIGTDLFGDIISKKLESHGCPMHLIRDEHGETSYTIVIAPKGSDRAFLHDPGSNHTFCTEDLDWEEIKKADYFHFGYPTLMRRFYENEGEELLNLYRTLKELGITTSLDLTAVDPESEAGKCNWKDILRKVLPYVDFFVPSIEELGYMIDQKRYQKWQDLAAGEDIVSILSLKNDVRPLAEKVLSFGCGAVLLKCGAAGMYLKTSGKERILQADPDLEGWEEIELFEDSFVPDRILSGTGAGDTSIGAFLYAAMQGCTPKESVEYAAATGACCVSTYDTISGLKSFPELREKIQKGWEKQKIIKE
ncbi:carbohydrate kinase family protein [Mediterraneibacter glycyrrhizinilyticus]|uniref:carbohydrate kinase family protein n=1 Tax=Mediterraneibacter glycyrrhizinilyticus TaxID=342942 RepID=UPI0025A49F13|nr:carbohydrate kinase family protein [Mediterraneibacter glycyrrhizinilyticus]MDM8126492.1 carbohydrate kinase family protein [Mediterraneibacter glycyrrhizinilyticus]